MQKKLYKCFIWDGRKCRDLCKKNYTNVLYGTDGNVETYAKKNTNVSYETDGNIENYTNVLYGTDGNIETYAKKLHKCFIWDGRKRRDLCKKISQMVYMGRTEMYSLMQKKITQMCHMGRTETRRTDGRTEMLMPHISEILHDPLLESLSPKVRD